MWDRTKMNAMRSGLVVIGALAFGYLTLQLGFKPFLEKAQVAAAAAAAAAASADADASPSSPQDPAALRDD